jgi:hypothetical protein
VQQQHAQQQPHVQQQQEQQTAQSQPLLLAVACGDKTVRVLPLAATAADRRSSGTNSQHNRQLVLWQGITDKVTAAAWQPLAGPQAAPADKEGGAPAVEAAATAAMAVGCEDGSVALLLPSREQALPLPVKHQVSSWLPYFLIQPKALQLLPRLGIQQSTAGMFATLISRHLCPFWQGACQWHILAHLPHVKRQ